MLVAQAAHTARAAQTVQQTGTRDSSTDPHDVTTLPARPGQFGAWGGAIGVQGAPVHCTGVRVDQVIPSLASRDAVGVHTLNLRDGLRAVGIDYRHLLRQLHEGHAGRGAAGHRARPVGP